MYELWREIIEFPEYEVSNTGFVRNKKTGRILKSYLNRPGGYLRVDLFGKSYYVHRLVYETFNGYIDRTERVMFLDKDHTNTNINNLYAHQVGFEYPEYEDIDCYDGDYFAW